MSLRDTLEHLLSGKSLTEAEAGDLLRAIVASDVDGTEMPPALAGALLAALRSKGVSADEVRGFARAMRSLARVPAIPQGSRAIDIVGTGGDSSGSFNLSTGAALLTAAGSADVLEQLGLKLPLDESAAGACLAATKFTFLFAPHYHPAMKAVAPIRQAMGVRTVFNILGPLTNPAAPLFQLTGAFNLPTAQLMAETLSGLPIERAFVVHGAEGWDEPTPLGPFTVLDVRPGQVRAEMRSPSDYGLDLCGARDLAGGDSATNAKALRAVLEGTDKGPHRDALLLGTALALEVVGRVDHPRDGVAMAKQAIDSGAARRTLDALAAFGKGAGL